MKATYFDKLNQKHVLNIDIDYADFYLEDFYKSDLVKIDIRKHRRYTFENDFDIDRDYMDVEYDKNDYYYDEWKAEQEKYQKILDENYVFGLNFYEHSIISFSLVEKRMDLGYYEMDRSGNVWIIAVKKDWLDYKQALEIAENTIENYNNYCNGWIYSYRITDENEDFIDWCTGYYGEEYAEKDALNYVKYYIEEQGLKMDNVVID